MASVIVDQDVDLGMWLWVPLAFPDVRSATMDAWAAEIGDSLAGAGADDAQRGAWRQLLTGVAGAAVPGDDVVGRVLHVSRAGATLLVAHLRVAPESGAPAGQLAVDGLATGGLQRLDAVEHPRLTGAWRAVSVGTLESGTSVALERRSGTEGGLRVTLEALVADPAWLAVADDDLGALFLALGAGD